MQTLPIPPPTRIPFATGGDILMTDDSIAFDGRVALHQCLAEPRRLSVLGSGEGLILITDHLDADGKIVAVLPALPTGLAGMPGALATGDVLRHTAPTVDEEVGGDPEAGKFGEVRMGSAIESTEEKIVDGFSIELAGRQADSMQNDHVDDRPRRSTVKVR